MEFDYWFCKVCQMPYLEDPRLKVMHFSGYINFKHLKIVSFLEFLSDKSAYELIHSCWGLIICTKTFSNLIILSKVIVFADNDNDRHFFGFSTFLRKKGCQILDKSNIFSYLMRIWKCLSTNGIDLQNFMIL